MSRDASGTYTLPSTFAVANAVPSSTTINGIMDDIENALTESINKDGTKAWSSNQPVGGFKFTNLGLGTARTDSVVLSQVQDGKLNWVDGGGTADAITATYSPAITALVDGQICCVRATTANATTTPTFAPNGLTARTIVKYGNQALEAGDIRADGHELLLRYDLTNTRWELLNPVPRVTPSNASDTVRGIVELSTAAEYRNDTADRALTGEIVWDAAASVALTDDTTIAVDFAAGINFTVTLGGNRTLGQPSNQKVGQSGFIRIVQDGTGSRTLAYHADWKFQYGTDPTLTTTASATDILFYTVIAANFVYATLVKAAA